MTEYHVIQQDSWSIHPEHIRLLHQAMHHFVLKQFIIIWSLVALPIWPDISVREHEIRNPRVAAPNLALGTGRHGPSFHTVTKWVFSIWMRKVSWLFNHCLSLHIQQWCNAPQRVEMVQECISPVRYIAWNKTINHNLYFTFHIIHVICWHLYLFYYPHETNRSRKYRSDLFVTSIIISDVSYFGYW